MARHWLVCGLKGKNILVKLVVISGKKIRIWKFFKRVKCTFVLFYIRRIQFIILFNNKLLIQYIYCTITCTCNLCTSRLHLRITQRPPPGEYPAGDVRFFLILDLRSSVYPYFHQQLRLLHVQKSIRFCKYGDADAGDWYTERSASQNGMLLTDYFEAVFVKNNSRQGMNFLRKFNHFMRFRAFRSDIWSPARIYDTARRSHTEIAQL